MCGQPARRCTEFIYERHARIYIPNMIPSLREEKSPKIWRGGGELKAIHHSKAHRSTDCITRSEWPKVKSGAPATEQLFGHLFFFPLFFSFSCLICESGS